MQLGVGGRRYRVSTRGENPPSIERCAEINVRDKLASLGEQCDSQDSGGYKMGARLPLLARR